MRPAGQGPFDSLYFRYPHFDAKDVPELHASHSHHAPHPVVIAGAGPIGMTAALILARHGVRSVLLDRKSTFNDGSRAICIARASMQILERAGAVDAFVAKALPWQYGRSYYKGVQIYRLEMPHPPGEKYMPMWNLQQQYIEQYLHDAVARSPLIDMRWQSEVTGVEGGDDGAVVKVSSPKGDYALHAQYLLAADGARSPIRGMLGLRLSGENYEGRYVIADVQTKHDFPTERRAFFEPAGNPGGTVLVHKQPDDIWRIDYQLRDNEDADDAVREDNIRARVQAIFDDIGHREPWALEWWSVYTANTLCLDDYRHGRVFFIGDSAHIVPIFGVRGLNNGLADAHNIAWKLAAVLQGPPSAHPEVSKGPPEVSKGCADDALLDSYTPERRGATLDVFANAGKSARFMTPPTRGWQLAREAALSLAVKHHFTRGFANPRQMLPYSYADSPLTTSDAAPGGGAVPGSAAPNPRLVDGGHLLDGLGAGFTVVVFGDADVDEAVERLRSVDPDVTLRRADRAAADAFGVPERAVVLLRPDLHIAARWSAPPQVDELERALRKALGGTA